MSTPLKRITFACIYGIMFFSLYVPMTVQQRLIVLHGRSFPADYVVYGALSILAGLLTFRHIRARLTRKGLPLAALIAIWLLSCLLSAHHGISFKSLTGLLMKGIIAGWVTFHLVKTKKQALWITRFMVLGIAANAAIGLPEYAHNTGRLYGAIGHALPLGTLLTAGMTLSLGCLSPLIALVDSALLGPSLLLTFSRSSWLIAASGIVFIWVRYKPWRKLLAEMIAVNVLLVSILAICLLKTNNSRVYELRSLIRQRFTDVQTSGRILPAWASLHREPAISHRLASYITSWRMVRNHPWFGLGIGTFSQEYNLYAAPGSAKDIPSPDNIVLRLWSETGFIGITAWIVFMVVWFKYSIRKIHCASNDAIALRKSCFLAACALWLNSLFFDGLFWNPVLLAISILMALSSGDWT
jgi:O-antigen ligase